MTKLGVRKGNVSTILSLIVDAKNSLTPLLKLETLVALRIEFFLKVAAETTMEICRLIYFCE